MLISWKLVIVLIDIMSSFSNSFIWMRYDLKDLHMFAFENVFVLDNNFFVYLWKHTYYYIIQSQIPSYEWDMIWYENSKRFVSVCFWKCSYLKVFADIFCLPEYFVCLWKHD